MVGVPEPEEGALFRVLDGFKELGTCHHLGGSWVSPVNGVPRQARGAAVVA